MVWCEKYFDNLDRAGVDHKYDRRTDRQTDRQTDIQNGLY